MAEDSAAAPGGHFGGKPKARKAVWDRLQLAGVVAAGSEGSVPDFPEMGRAVARLFDLPVVAGAGRMKVGSEPSLGAVRREAVGRGITLYVATAGLAAGYRCIAPAAPGVDLAGLEDLSNWDALGRLVSVTEVPVLEVPPMDVIVVGSVAVTRRGDRCGPGGGGEDLEYGILRALGHPPAPVVTAVHGLQMVDFFPTYEHDLPLSHIAMPEELTSIEVLAPIPRGIDWDRVTTALRRAMPFLDGLGPKTT